VGICRNLLIIACCSLVGCSECANLITGKNDTNSPEGRAIQSIVHKETFRFVRRTLRSQIDEEFQMCPSMRYEDYEKRAVSVHSLGESFNTTDEVVSDLQTKTLRDTALRRKIRPEEIYNLVKWGPFYINDEGSIRFSVKSFWDIISNQGDSFSSASFVEDDQVQNHSLNIYNDWKLSAHVDVQIDPISTIEKQDTSRLGRKFGVTFEINRLFNIQTKSIFSIENQVEINSQGEGGYYLNFILK